MPAVIDGSQMQDAVPTLAVLAAFNDTPVRFVGIANLRVKECDRITALSTELSRIQPGLAHEEGDDLIVPAKQEMRIRSDLGGAVPKLEDQPWPAFPADVMSIAIVTATQCDGIILMHEKMFESRMFFVDKLVSMGARIVLCAAMQVVLPWA